MTKLSLVLLLTLLAAGCTMGQQAQLAPTPDIAASVTAAVAQTSSPVPKVTPTSAASATAEPFAPISVSTWADNVVLHDNPGHLATNLGVLADNTQLSALGKTPGGEWLLVQAPGNRLGWVFTALVEGGGDTPLPVIEPKGVIVLRGTLADPSGRPVTGVQFAVVQAGASVEIRTDATTDAQGVFYAFLPADSRGSWWISYAAISCESNVMDPTCRIWTGEPFPRGMYVQLPGGAHTPLRFEWK